MVSFARRRILVVPNLYPWFFSLTALASLLWLAVSRPRRKPTAEGTGGVPGSTRFDVGVAGLAGGLIGARLAYVLQHTSYYQAQPSEVLAYWQGGLDWFGGIVGSLLGLWIFSRASFRPFWDLADLLALPALFISIAAWVGCFFDGCAYGRLTGPAWWAPETTDSFGTVASRWPTQAAGALLTVASLAVLLHLAERPLPAGVRACLAVGGCAASVLLVSAGRGDASPSILGLRADALGAAGLLAAVLTVSRTLSRRAATS